MNTTSVEGFDVPENVEQNEPVPMANANAVSVSAPQPVVATPAPAPAKPQQSDDLPTTFEGVMAERVRLNNLGREHTPAECSRLKKLDARFLEMQNGALPPPTGAQERWQEGQSRYHVHLENRAAAALQKVEAVPAVDLSDLERQKLAPKKRLLVEVEMRPLIQSVREAARDYELALIAHDEQLNPDRHVENLKHRIAHASDKDEVETLRAKIVQLQTATKEARHVAVRLIAPSFDALRQAVNACHEKAAELVDTYAIEAETAEALFAEQFGLPRIKTEVSARVDRLKGELKQAREALARLRSDELPSAEDVALSWFTVRNLFSQG